MNLRLDAQENRDRILEVAREALSADPQASMNSIAKAANVGPGTLYRHFPNRESLVLAVYRNEIDKLATLVPTLLARYSPLTAFRKWCDQLAKFGRVKHGISDVLDAAKSDKNLKETYLPMLTAVRTLMTACEDSGEIAKGANAEDFLMLLGTLWRIPPTAAGKARVSRLLALVFRGLGAKF
jgi:AcrR family transcriptional regulator